MRVLKAAYYYSS